MKKYLFISNSSKPSKEELRSRDKVELTNFSKPNIEIAQSMGYEVYMGINRINPEELESDYDIKFYYSSTYRSLFDIKSNYIAIKNLLKLLKKEKIDVIHCNTPIGGVVGRICGRIAKVPKVIYTAHGFHFYKGAPLINNTIFKWAEKLMARFTDAIITINEEDFQAAQKFKLRNNGNVYYVPGVGVDTKLFQRKIDAVSLKRSLGLKKDDIVLISMGDLVHRKNYLTSIKAIAETNNPNLHLLICGKGPELEALQSLSKQKGVDNQIHFLGYRRDIKDLLQLADIFLFTTYQEGLPRSMMEAMASGLPCVASKIRGNVDLIEDGIGGFLCPPDDIIGFSEAIKKLASDKDLRKSMGTHNLQTIKKFDVENIKKELRKIYEKELL